MNNNGFPGFTATWIVPAVLIALALVVAAGLFAYLVFRPGKGEREAPRHDKSLLPAVKAVAHRPVPWPDAAPPAHPQPSMVPVEPGLEPLPGRELTDEEVADIKKRFAAAMEHGRPPLTIVTGDSEVRAARDPGEQPPSVVTDDRPATVSEACWYGPCTDCREYPDCDCGHHREGTVTVRPATRAQTTGEIFEHLCEGIECWCHSFRRVPQQVYEGLGRHWSADEALNSIVLRSEKEADRFRAELEARLAKDDAARANGQVSHG